MRCLSLCTPEGYGILFPEVTEPDSADGEEDQTVDLGNGESEEEQGAGTDKLQEKPSDTVGHQQNGEDTAASAAAVLPGTVKPETQGENGQIKEDLKQLHRQPQGRTVDAELPCAAAARGEAPEADENQQDQEGRRKKIEQIGRLLFEQQGKQRNDQYGYVQHTEQGLPAYAEGAQRMVRDGVFNAEKKLRTEVGLQEQENRDQRTAADSEAVLPAPENRNHDSNAKPDQHQKHIKRDSQHVDVIVSECSSVCHKGRAIGDAVGA